ncbi:probable sodium/metabolite cotransporter BASS5, chloroplastic isoform X1 [Eucalyptus grandis]|uniref:probable sodium/metabolite cotransporter BASS5, chloroplastic isoform X1 n=1 Tax=Eucalyptus grandis TaxID=71139 RepID=UPI0008A0EC59|nr:probable sodium/metabolite cotransporter BASS5, chloroplastic isoform X1 [Eucalyptus grandis]
MSLISTRLRIQSTAPASAGKGISRSLSSQSHSQAGSRRLNRSRYYAPALGFRMFAVRVNSSERDFLEAFRRPAAIFARSINQFIEKPLLGYFFGMMSVAMVSLPTSIGAGIMLLSCISAAQLSNYATSLIDPSVAPLSIVMTSLSTATAVFVTPLLSLLLIGKRLPVHVKGMVSSILQIVVTPIAAGLLLNRLNTRLCYVHLLGSFSSLISHSLLLGSSLGFLMPYDHFCRHSVFVTALCVGAPLVMNVDSIISSFGLTILSLVIAFHLIAFVTGYFLPGFFFRKAPAVKALRRALSFETGMQSSLLALALGNRFFQDPLVAVPPAISPACLMMRADI